MSNVTLHPVKLLLIQVLVSVFFFVVGIGLGFMNGRVYQIRRDTEFFYHLADPGFPVTPTPTPAGKRL